MFGVLSGAIGKSPPGAMQAASRSDARDAAHLGDLVRLLLLPRREQEALLVVGTEPPQSCHDRTGRRDRWIARLHRCGQLLPQPFRQTNPAVGRPPLVREGAPGNAVEPRGGSVR